MHVFSRRTVFSATLVFGAVALYTAPASAMGRSGASSSRPTVAQAANCLSQAETRQKNVITAIQSQVEALRRELADLKTAVNVQGVAAAE